ncbi:MAG: redox-regulated ATPase YchF [Actinobacteria bacterium]|nr:redox-regulated ATPase YchF [Actinomycetota bacterium]MBM3711972.1 redox-regulated ATPase YchF [Actinomycetota bacterium]
MQVGIIGLPNVGKSTIFNALTKANASVASYPFCTIEPNIGLIYVPDPNLNELAGIYNSEKITYASIKFLDVAGLVKGASKGEGLGNKFLAHIREVDVVAHIVRCFVDDNVSHISQEINPESDIEIINTELLLADIEALERRREKFTGLAKSGDLNARNNLETVNYLIGLFNKGSIHDVTDLYEKNTELFLELNLLSLKPALYVANLNDDEQSSVLYKKLQESIKKREIVKIYGKLENELLELPEEERASYRKELGIDSNGLNSFILKCYGMLNLITFYTINENEARAWSLTRGSKVIDAAGKIHSDMQKGFIKAEVINCNELLSIGSIHKAKEDGKIRIEGREYQVKDKDIILIKFAV